MKIGTLTVIYLFLLLDIRNLVISSINQVAYEYNIGDEIYLTINAGFKIDAVNHADYLLHNINGNSCPDKKICYQINENNLTLTGKMHPNLQELIYTNGELKGQIKFKSNQATETLGYYVGYNLKRGFEVPFKIQKIICESLPISNCVNGNYCIKLHNSKTILVQGILPPVNHYITLYGDRNEKYTIQFNPINNGKTYYESFGKLIRKSFKYNAKITKISTFPKLPKLTNVLYPQESFGYYLDNDQKELIVCGRILTENIYIFIYSNLQTEPKDVINILATKLPEVTVALGEQMYLNIEPGFIIKSLDSNTVIFEQSKCTDANSICYKYINDQKSIILSGHRSRELSFIRFYTDENKTDDSTFIYFNIHPETYCINIPHGKTFKQFLSSKSKIKSIISNVELTIANPESCAYNQLCYSYNIHNTSILLSGIMRNQIKYVTIFASDDFTAPLMTLLFNCHNTEVLAHFHFNSIILTTIFILLFGILLCVIIHLRTKYTIKFSKFTENKNMDKLNLNEYEMAN